MVSFIARGGWWVVGETFLDREVSTGSEGKAGGRTHLLLRSFDNAPSATPYHFWTIATDKKYTSLGTFDPAIFWGTTLSRG